jgi:competence protein ComGC
MKPRHFNKLNFRLIVILIISLVIFIVHSCKKDNSTNQDTSTSNTAIVNLAKQWYGATYPINRSNNNFAVQTVPAGTSAWSQTFIPDWTQANTYIIDSLTYIELPAIKRGDMAMSIKI